MKVYAGAPAAARNYVECDRGRADDYYLAEGAGIARRFTATEGRVTELAPLTGEAYETWVAGRDPVTGAPRGILRTDPHAVRFVEVVVNGPKTWSIAAALHPDIAQAYEAAQDRAAQQILGWLSAHATTRVGPRGGQVPVPIGVLEAASVRHYTSRAGDPHWHLHLQINARVFAAGKWRGLWTVDVRDSLAAINGIGHAAMGTDPEFTAALAAHGYRRDATGEIRQLVGYVGAFSARHAQIARNADRYAREWTAAHPGEIAGPGLRRAWDARAWAAGRPDKVTPARGMDLSERWRAELADLGFRPPSRPVDPPVTPVGALDRDQLVRRALTRLGAARSAWNAADIRGEVERLIAEAGIVAEAPVRLELGEDLTARALDRCVPLLDRDGVPEHIRVWTSRPVLAVETDLSVRLSFRAAESHPGTLDTNQTRQMQRAVLTGRLDPEQAAVVTALAGERSLLVIEGAAGAGKTTTLAATRELLARQGRRLVVVTPTLKAAQVAAAELGAPAGSVARLAYEHGWRWDADGAWTRLNVGDLDPVTGRLCTVPGDGARLRPGDLLVVDEAGMLDQDTARALLTVADECRVRLALVGDRHQLSAVGRGGVLELALGHIDAEAHLTLGRVHRFTRPDATGQTVPDVAYADLTLAMRTGWAPGAVFDALLARGQIRLHPDLEALRDALAELAASSYAAGDPIAVVADTREQVADLNAAIRDRLVAAGRVDELSATVTAAGEWIGVGDRVVTRRNDRELDVANRELWTVAQVGRYGALELLPADPAAGTGRWPEARVVPAGYAAEHVQLAYATTAHGVQGQTVAAAHVVVGEHTGAASAYVGMTRGRAANTAHLVAADVEEAREQWITVFARDRADLGPAHAAALAVAEAAGYAPAQAPNRAPGFGDGVPDRAGERLLAELRAAWTEQQRLADRLELQQLQVEAVRGTAQLHAEDARRLAALQATAERTRAVADAARARAEAGAAAVGADADRLRCTLLERWAGDREAARAAAQTVLAGPGRLGLHRAAVARAHAQLTDWFRDWAPHLPALRADILRLPQLAAGPDDPLDVEAGLQDSARRTAEHAHPEQARLAGDAGRAQRDHDLARYELRRAGDNYRNRYRGEDQADYTRQLTDLTSDLATTARQLSDTRARISALHADPALQTQRPGFVAHEMQAWRADRAAADRAVSIDPDARAADPDIGPHNPYPDLYPAPHHSPGPGIGI